MVVTQEQVLLGAKAQLVAPLMDTIVMVTAGATQKHNPVDMVMIAVETRFHTLTNITEIL